MALMVLIQEKPGVEKEWSGEAKRFLDGGLYLVDTKEDWERLWRLHEGPSAKAPEVDFAKSWVVASFDAVGDGKKQRRQVKSVAEKNGTAIVEFESKADEKASRPFTFVQFAKPAGGKVWVKPTANAGMEPARLGKAAEGIDEIWLGAAAKGTADDVVRITDAKAWADVWKRAHPELDAPAIDFEKRMVVAVFLAAADGSVRAAGFAKTKDGFQLALGSFSGPAVSAPVPRYVLAVVERRKEALTVELEASSFDHRETTKVRKVLKKLEALEK